MAVAQHAVCSDTYWDTTADITTDTNRRDVSDMLELWAHKNTPFLNKLSWGKDSGGISIEWISEHLGFGYLCVAAVQGSATQTFSVGVSGLSTAAQAAAQVTSGTLLFAYSSTDCELALMWVESVTSPVVTYVLIAVTTSTAYSSTVGDKIYIIGDVANEGSAPRADKSRARAVITNAMAILREDVQITGSMAQTDFHAIEDETKHQIKNRLLEMQRHREMLVLMSQAVTRSATVAGLFDGAFGYAVADAAKAWVKIASQDFTETTVNDIAATLADNGANPNCLVGSITQLRKFTKWDQSKVRTKTEAKLGGHNITQYLTDTGAVVDLCMIPHFPVNIAYMLDTDKVKLRAKKGRKLLLQKLGLDGDRERWQLISEFSVEFRGWGTQGQHGAWLGLNT